MHRLERIQQLMELRQAIAEALKLPESHRRYPQEEALISQYVVAYKLDEQVDASNELINVVREQGNGAG